MALGLGLKRGQDVMLGNDGRTRLILDELLEENKVKVVVFIDDVKSSFIVTDECSVEVAPNVRVSLGNTSREGIVRVLFEAPRSIKILRGELYREDLIAESEGAVDVTHR